MLFYILRSALIEGGFLCWGDFVVAKIIQFARIIKEELVAFICFIYLFCLIFVFDVVADTYVILCFF